MVNSPCFNKTKLTSSILTLFGILFLSGCGCGGFIGGSSTSAPCEDDRRPKPAVDGFPPYVGVNPREPSQCAVCSEPQRYLFNTKNRPIEVTLSRRRTDTIQNRDANEWNGVDEIKINLRAREEAFLGCPSQPNGVDTGCVLRQEWRVIDWKYTGRAALNDLPQLQLVQMVEDACFSLGANVNGTQIRDSANELYGLIERSVSREVVHKKELMNIFGVNNDPCDRSDMTRTGDFEFENKGSKCTLATSFAYEGDVLKGGIVLPESTLVSVDIARIESGEILLEFLKPPRPSLEIDDGDLNAYWGGGIKNLLIKPNEIRIKTDKGCLVFAAEGRESI
jgi:hypothetical protein